VDDTKRTNDSLNQEVVKLRSQVYILLYASIDEQYCLDE
jgi:hypothetical protein